MILNFEIVEYFLEHFFDSRLVRDFFKAMFALTNFAKYFLRYGLSIREIFHEKSSDSLEEYYRYFR